MQSEEDGHAAPAAPQNYPDFRQFAYFAWAAVTRESTWTSATRARCGFGGRRCGGRDVELLLLVGDVDVQVVKDVHAQNHVAEADRAAGGGKTRAALQAVLGIHPLVAHQVRYQLDRRVGDRDPFQR